MAKNKLKTTAQIAVDFVKKLRLLSRKLRCYCCYWDEVLYMSRAVCWYIYRTFITKSQQIMCVILWFYLSGLAFDCADWWSCLFGWWLLFASVSRLKLWGSPNVGWEGSVCNRFPKPVCILSYKQVHSYPPLPRLHSDQLLQRPQNPKQTKTSAKDSISKLPPSELRVC